MPASWVVDESKWKKAKKLAEDQGRGGDYAYITGIYQKMGGRKKASTSKGRVSLSTTICPSADELLAKGWVELPESFGDEVWKGAGHKYIKRIPNPSGKGYRYFYHVAHGGGVGREDHMVVGAAFQHKGGHYHITEEHADGTITVKHDETGDTKRVSKNTLRSVLRAHHFDAIEDYRSKIKQEYTDAMAHGTDSQKQAAWKRARRAGVKVPKPDDIARQKEMGEQAKVAAARSKYDRIKRRHAKDQASDAELAAARAALEEASGTKVKPLASEAKEPAKPAAPKPEPKVSRADQFTRDNAAKQAKRNEAQYLAAQDKATRETDAAKRKQLQAEADMWAARWHASQARAKGEDASAHDKAAREAKKRAADLGGEKVPEKKPQGERVFHRGEAFTVVGRDPHGFGRFKPSVKIKNEDGRTLTVRPHETEPFRDVKDRATPEQIEAAGFKMVDGRWMRGGRPVSEPHVHEASLSQASEASKPKKEMAKQPPRSAKVPSSGLAKHVHAVSHSRGYTGKKSGKSYLAEISGTHSKYGLDRNFREKDSVDWGGYDRRKRKGTWTESHDLGHGLYEKMEHGERSHFVVVANREGTGYERVRVSETEAKSLAERLSEAKDEEGVYAALVDAVNKKESKSPRQAYLDQIAEEKRARESKKSGDSFDADIAKAYVEQSGGRWLVKDGPLGRVVGSSKSKREAERLLEQYRRKKRMKNNAGKGSNMNTDIFDDILHGDHIHKADDPSGLVALYEEVCKASEIDMAVVDAKIRGRIRWDENEGMTEDQLAQSICDSVVCELAVGHNSDKGAPVLRSYVAEYGIDGLMSRVKALLKTAPRRTDDGSVPKATGAVAPHPFVGSLMSANGMPLV